MTRCRESNLALLLFLRGSLLILLLLHGLLGHIDVLLLLRLGLLAGGTGRRLRLLSCSSEDSQCALVEGEGGRGVLVLLLVGLEVGAEVAGEGELLVADVAAERFVAWKKKGGGC